MIIDEEAKICSIMEEEKVSSNHHYSKSGNAIRRNQVPKTSNHYNKSDEVALFQNSKITNFEELVKQ